MTNSVQQQQVSAFLFYLHSIDMGFEIGGFASRELRL